MKIYPTILIIPFLLLNIFCLNAETITVNSVPALQIAINKASAGDILILASGTYLNNVLTISTHNITVKASTPGSVFLNGTNKMIITGNNITFSGFQFTSGDIGLGSILEVSGNYNILSHLNFSGYHSKKYIVIKAGSQYNTITYCNIEKKPINAEIGCTIQISTSPTVPGYHKISYCSFQNFEGTGGDFGNEPIRIGLGAEALNPSRTIVEYCYFNNTGLGDSESVSVKSQENIIRFCTFTNQQNAMLVFRNGNKNVAYSNFFIKAGGIRIKEADYIFCYNNYFENAGLGGSSDAITLDYVSPMLNNIHFYHNTFVQCGDIDLGGLGPTKNYWANNLFVKSSGKIFLNPNNENTFLGNLYDGESGISIPAGMQKTAIYLEKNTDGYQGITTSSPAINASADNFPPIFSISGIDIDSSILKDISGQFRPANRTLKDVGCDEYATDSISNRPLKLSAAGPSYLKNEVVAISFDNTEGNNKILIYPNPVSDNFKVKLFNDPIKNLEVQFFDINGKEIKNYKFQDTSLLGNEINFSVTDFQDGVYLVIFKILNNLKTIKLMVQH
jgi:hypothetical protein